MSRNGEACEDHDNYRILNDDPSKTVSFDLPSDYVLEKVSENRAKSTIIHMGHVDHEQDDEEDIDEQDIFSIFSSVMTADRITDPISFRINLFVIFLGDMGRGIFFPTMWNLIQTLGGNELNLGYLIGSFSFGRVLVLPLLGHLSNVYGTRFVNKITLLLLASGSFLFSLVLNVRKMWFMLLANLLIGVGSGNLGVTFSYASAVTPRRKRTSYLALCCAIQYAGTTGTPFIGSLYVWLFGEKTKRGFPEINEFTAPALTMCILCLCAFALVHFQFKDAPKKDAKQQKKIMSSRQQAYDSFANTPLCFGKTSLYTVILISCMFLNAFGKGPMSCFETLGIEFAESLYGIDHANAGLIVASCGLLGCIILFLVKLSFSKHEDSSVIMVGILLFALGITMNMNLDENNAEQNSVWRFAFSMFLAYSVGYPVCHTATVGLFSKIAGRRPQGVLLGFFSMVGSISRVLFPIMAGFIVSDGDADKLFILLLCFLGISTTYLLLFRKTLTRLASD